jgi:hypothetical protein
MGVTLTPFCKKKLSSATLTQESPNEPYHKLSQNQVLK